jgi:ribose transport system substrate-binding protein
MDGSVTAQFWQLRTIVGDAAIHAAYITGPQKRFPHDRPSADTSPPVTPITIDRRRVEGVPMPQSLSRFGIATVLVLIGTLGLSACGGSSSEDDGGSGGASADGSASGSDALAVAYEGVTGAPPTEATTPPSDVSLWVVSCGEQIPSCAAPTAGTVQAGETAGWDVEVCDGQMTPNGWGACVRQAISAGADVIIPIGLDCVSIQQPFQEAKDAGVTVVGGGGADCDVVGGPKLWASERIQLEGYSVQELFELQGRLAADWFIGRSDGQAKVLNIEFTDPLWGPWVTAALQEHLATCAECEVVETLQVSNADVIGGTLVQKFSTALLQNPDVNSVFVPVGGWMPAGLGQAVQSSGRSADLDVISILGIDANLELIRNDAGQDALVGYPIEWGGWGSVDTAIRVLNGEEPQVQGDGFQVVDAENNLPPAGESFTSGVDYRAAYEKAWGV